MQPGLPNVLRAKRRILSGRLSFLSAEAFERFLAAASTVAGLTLSSGDSDPLLHPRIEEIIDVARRHDTTLDIYTNGHPLNERKCHALVDSRIVKMINFSIDAATPETYRAIRGENLARPIANIEMLQLVKRASGEGRMDPWVSMSFVAMADNVAELPDFVALAHRLEARRVLVEDLGGWKDGAGGNRSAADDPRCYDHVAEACRRAADAGLELALPERLKPRPVTSKVTVAGKATVFAPASIADTGEPSADSSQRLACCGWIRGVWVEMDGRIEPCCLVHNVADMGNINDGPLFTNEKHAGERAAPHRQRLCKVRQPAAVPVRATATGGRHPPLRHHPRGTRRPPSEFRGRNANAIKCQHRVNDAAMKAG